MLSHYWCTLCRRFSWGWSSPAFLLWLKSGIPEPLSEISAHVNQSTPGRRFCTLRSSLNGRHLCSHTAVGNVHGKETQPCTCVHMCISTFTYNHTKTKLKQNTNICSLIFLFLFKSQDQAVVWATLTQISFDFLISHWFTLMAELASYLEKQSSGWCQAQALPGCSCSTLILQVRSDREP